MGEKIVKTIRFDRLELKEIEIFLEKNPLLDFSTLVRISVMNFIKNPEFKFNSVDVKEGYKNGSSFKQ